MITDLSSQTYPIPFVSRSLDWLAWLGLARLASAWLVLSAAAVKTATTPEQASTTKAAAEPESMFVQNVKETKQVLGPTPLH